MKGIILSAGKGERLMPLTETMPKPLVPIKARPLLEYNLRLLKYHNIDEVCINTSYLANKIKETIGTGEKLGLKIHYSFEPELLGTSGALNNFRTILDETFVVIYGDNLTDINLQEMLQHHKKNKAIVTIALRNKPKDYKTQSLILATPELKITKFLEKPSDEEVQKITGDHKLINSGIYIMEPEIFNYLPDGFSDFAYDIFPKLIQGGHPIFGFLIDKYYFREVGRIDKYELAKSEVESGKVKFYFMPGERGSDKLELGSGEKPTHGYLHQDITPMPGVDLDFTCNPWEIPLPENTLSEVLALGLVEHLRFEEVRMTLRHMHKILKKGGSFLFDVPDMKVWSEYLYNTTHGMSDKNPFPDSHTWNTIYGWQRWPGDEHKSGWTKESLVEEVKKAGFAEVEEGVHIFTSKGIQRGRFTRPGDAHIYIKAIK